MPQPGRLEVTSHLALNCWHNLNAHLSGWAFRAYARLLQTLSQDVQILSSEGCVPKPYVVIFGKTQVGKTTLLLDLMGIDAASMPTVSQVLRGGRESGKSATATAMEYCRSADHRWGVALDAEPLWFEENDLITQKLGDIREAMEAGRLSTQQPCVVHIPRHFFGKGDTSSPHVRILDLPGDNPANGREQEHVNKVAKKHLPFADMVLLVGRGDDLSFLRPEVITLPGIEDWQVMPHRFRIVTTYSCYAQSVKDLIRKDADFNVTQLRRRLIDQIQLFNELSEAARSESLYFPLEFGTSWTGMREQEPLLYERVAPIIGELRRDLLTQIQECTSPMGRLRNTLNTHLSVKHVLQKKKSELKDKLNKLHEKSEKLGAEFKFWKDKVHEHKEKITLLSESASRRGDFCLKKAPPNAPTPYQARDDAKDAEELHKMVRSLRYSLKNMRPVLFKNTKIEDRNSKFYKKKVFSFFKDPDEQSKEDLLSKSFFDIHNKLNDYTVNWYLLVENYKKDLAMVRESSEKAKIQLTELFTARWMEAQKNADIELREELRREENDFSSAIDEQSKILNQQNLLAPRRLQLINNLIDITRRGEEDLERCDRFTHLLDEEYLQALDHQMDGVAQTEDDCDALLILLSCEEMRHQRKNLIAMEAKRTGYESCM